MTDSIYRKLREQFDQYSVGFPATASGVEIKILKKLFSEEQAKMYLDMTMGLETPESVAERTGQDLTRVDELLEAMAQKGLLFRKRGKGQVRYAVVPFVVGSYEFQLKNMDRELSQLIEAYFQEGFMEISSNKYIPPLRTIPVQQSIELNHTVAPYVQAREIVKTKEKIAVADCICRQQQQLLAKGCNKPKEVCFSFGSHADYYVENRLGRYITQEEALAVLDKCEAAGLVNQPANVVNPGGMCNCCGDCCGLLRALNRLPNPAAMVYNNYSARVDSELCTACEICLERCQMAAITLNDQSVAVVNSDRCIGCGLCVTTCETEAIQLVLKPEAERAEVPASGRELMEKAAEIRGTHLIPLSMLEKDK